MFIIVGNDIKKKQVSIIDTLDYKTNTASYEVMYNAINRGIEILGIQAGEILCKTKNVFKEILPQLVHQKVKADLLKVHNSVRLEMYLNILKPYGLANACSDIVYIYETNTLVVKRLAVLVKLKNPTKIDYYVTLPYKDEFNNLDTYTKMMLTELCQIPLVPEPAEITFISRCTFAYNKGAEIENFYYIETETRNYMVGVLPYKQDFITGREFSGIRPNSPMFYRFYLQQLSHTSGHSCIISRLERLQNRTRRPEGTIIYGK